MKVCIVGLAESSRNQVPWGREGWEYWGLAEDPMRAGFHRVFEMHDDDRVPVEKLRDCALVYMQRACPEVPQSDVFPFEAVSQTCAAYWESSLAYAMSLAIHEGAEEIDVYGVDMDADEEYGYQKPNMEYLLGLARGRGIKVTLPASSPLLKFSGRFGYDGRYGRLP
jgi:hypothetical protein